MLPLPVRGEAWPSCVRVLLRPVCHIPCRGRVLHGTRLHEALAMARCPWCQRGALRMIAAITHGEGIRKFLQPLQRSADPPPIALARVRQAAFAWSSA